MPCCALRLHMYAYFGDNLCTFLRTVVSDIVTPILEELNRVSRQLKFDVEPFIFRPRGIILRGMTIQGNQLYTNKAPRLV
jgi:hypothetical protein